MMYKIAFEKASFGLALVDLSDGNFIDANPRFCEIIHREMDQLIGKQWPVIAGISDRELVKAQIRDFQETTNKSLCCDLSITIDFEDEQGRDVALISIHDMTEIKAANLRAKWSSDQLEAVLDAVPAAIWFFHDVNGEVVTANKVGRQWFDDSSDPSSDFCDVSGYNEILESFRDASGILILEAALSASPDATYAAKGPTSSRNLWALVAIAGLSPPRSFRVASAKTA